METVNYISKNERRFLIFMFTAVLFLTVASISFKFIDSYNLAVFDEQLNLRRQANNEGSFYITDCYSVYGHPAFFTLFSSFIFLVSFVFKKFSHTSFLLTLSFCFLSIWLIRVTFLTDWFLKITNIEWNSALIRFDIFDFLLWICFLTIVLFQTKILFRFAREKFRAKISLK